jgi:nucleoside-diphosphate-sugar epimerase
MRIFITGGAGFLGQRVVERLLAQGHSIRCLVRSNASAAELRWAVPTAGDRLEFVYGSLQDHPDLRTAMVGCQQVFHLAAALKGTAPALFLDTVIGTRALVNAAATLPIERFVLVSSIAVYGTYDLQRGSLLDERCAIDSEPHLRDPYTYSKIVQEQVCWEAHRAQGLPLVVIRPGVIYGPGRPTLLGRVGLAAGGLLIRLGRGGQLPCTYVENCADAVVEAARTESAIGRAYNIIDDEMPAAKDVIRLHRKYRTPLRVIRIPTVLVPSAAAVFEWYWERSGRLLPPVFTKYRAALWKPMRYTHRAATEDFGWQPRVATGVALQKTYEAETTASGPAA